MAGTVPHADGATARRIWLARSETAETAAGGTGEDRSSHVARKGRRLRTPNQHRRRGDLGSARESGTEPPIEGRGTPVPNAWCRSEARAPPSAPADGTRTAEDDEIDRPCKDDGTSVPRPAGEAVLRYLRLRDARRATHRFGGTGAGLAEPSTSATRTASLRARRSTTPTERESGSTGTRPATGRGSLADSSALHRSDLERGNSFGSRHAGSGQRSRAARGPNP